MSCGLSAHRKVTQSLNVSVHMTGAAREEKSWEGLDWVSGDVCVSGSISLNCVEATETDGWKTDVSETHAMRCKKVDRTVEMSEGSRGDVDGTVDSTQEKACSRRLVWCVCVWEWYSLCGNG